MLDMDTINRAKVMTSKSVQVHVLGLEQELVPIKYKSRYNSDFNGNMCESFISIFFHRFVPNSLRSGSVSLFELFIKKLMLSYPTCLKIASNDNWVFTTNE